MIIQFYVRNIYSGLQQPVISSGRKLLIRLTEHKRFFGTLIFSKTIEEAPVKNASFEKNNFLHYLWVLKREKELQVKSVPLLLLQGKKKHLLT